jgi:hypothetical protein
MTADDLNDLAADAWRIAELAKLARDVEHSDAQNSVLMEVIAEMAGDLNSRLSHLAAGLAQPKLGKPDGAR